MSLFKKKKQEEVTEEVVTEEINEEINEEAEIDEELQDNFNDDQEGLFDEGAFIIEDKEAESNRALREVSAGLLSKEEYREKIFGETEEIAKQKIKEIQESMPTAEELVGE